MWRTFRGSNGAAQMTDLVLLARWCSVVAINSVYIMVRTYGLDNGI